MDLAGTVDPEVVGVHGADLTEHLAVTNCSWRLGLLWAQVGPDCGRSDLGVRVAQGRADRIDSVFVAISGDELHDQS
ncbi:hypothetical protein GOSPT_019_00010, partial [Gordonia sputi NBRC 100414]